MKLRTLIGFAAVIATTGCTPAEIRAWVAWHEVDPEAAVEFASRPEIVEALASGQYDPGSSDGPQFAQQLAADGVRPGDCDSYVPLFEAYGLPAARFRAIAWRESGCNHRSFVSDSDDLGGGLLGLNLRAGAARWRDWCGLTVANVTDAETNVRCAAEAYRRLGLAPWR